MPRVSIRKTVTEKSKAVSKTGKAITSPTSKPQQKFTSERRVARLASVGVKAKTAVADIPTQASLAPRKLAAMSGKTTKAVVLLAGRNPQIARAEGDAPVQAYINALSGWQLDLGRRLDALIMQSVPNVHKAVKWNSPFYGIAEQGWFVAMHTFTNYIKLAFFRGTALTPMPPGTSKSKDTRYLDIHESDVFDQAQLTTWFKQAAALPGWSSSQGRRTTNL